MDEDAFWLGHTSELLDDAGNLTGGLFGIAVATMGLLSIAAYVLTMDMFGPIADNAGGLLGSMLIFLFSAWACSDVGRTAQDFLIMVL
ncbi:inorganic diphosphatase [Sarracenia purpurea var. burkii]